MFEDPAVRRQRDLFLEILATGRVDNGNGSSIPLSQDLRMALSDALDEERRFETSRHEFIAEFFPVVRQDIAQIREEMEGCPLPCGNYQHPSDSLSLIQYVQTTPWGRRMLMGWEMRRDDGISYDQP